jgi:hypothetical protein
MRSQIETGHTDQIFYLSPGDIGYDWVTNGVTPRVMEDSFAERPGAGSAPALRLDREVSAVSH